MRGQQVGRTVATTVSQCHHVVGLVSTVMPTHPADA